MTPEAFILFEAELLRRGYKKQSYNTFGHEDYSYYKSFAPTAPDEYGESRTQYQLFFCIYDYVKRAEELNRGDLPRMINVQPLVLVSRNPNEREEFVSMSNPDDIDFNESLAEKFFALVKLNCPLKQILGNDDKLPF